MENTNGNNNLERLMRRMERVSQIVAWLKEDPELMGMVYGNHQPIPQTKTINVPVALTVPTVKLDTPTPTPASAPAKDKGDRTYHAGFTARVLRYLSTGPTTVGNLMEVMAIDHRSFRNNLGNLVRLGYVTISDRGMVELTTKGAEEAAYFVANPHALLHRRSDRNRDRV